MMPTREHQHNLCGVLIEATLRFGLMGHQDNKCGDRNQRFPLSTTDFSRLIGVVPVEGQSWKGTLIEPSRTKAPSPISIG